MQFERSIYFDAVRRSLFPKGMKQQQVDGQEYILAQWEKRYPDGDPRHLAYMLATTKHETANTMWPVEEYGKGKGRSYGVADPHTGQTYYGRGFVQLTWRENYARASQELGLTGENDLVLHPNVALVPEVAADIMFAGMTEGWFRTGADGKPQTLARYFNGTRHDAYGAREIINGDKTSIPNWSGGVSIGRVIAGYHEHFLAALIAASAFDVEAAEPTDATAEPIIVRVIVPKGVKVEVEVV